MTWELTIDWLPWLLPPVLGAVIGFLTNALAIRMLFRPLTEKRVLGLRVPLTPGIIPYRRAELAESIARMVSERLITQEALNRQISSAEFREKVAGRIGFHTSHLLQTPLTELRGGRIPVVYETARTFSSEILRMFLSSRSFIVAVRSLAESSIRSLYGRKLSEVIDPEELSRALTGRLCPMLREPATRRWAKRRIGRWLDARLSENTSVREMIPEPLFRTALNVVEGVLPEGLETAVRWLRRSDTRRELETRGKLLLEDILGKLNILQRIFVSVAQYDRTLEERMPEIVDEALSELERWLEDPEVRTKILSSLERGAERWRARGFFDLVYDHGYPVRERVEGLVDGLFDLLASPSFEEHARLWLRSVMASQGEKTIGRLVGISLSLRESEVCEFVAEQILRYANRDRTADRLAERLLSTLSSFLEAEGDATVGGLLRIDRDRKAALDGFLTRRFVELLRNRLPEMVDSLGLRELVVEKINELDVSEVESLLLMVISRHLKWINIFGAFLGALIGLTQVLLRALGIL